MCKLWRHMPMFSKNSHYKTFRINSLSIATRGMHVASGLTSIPFASFPVTFFNIRFIICPHLVAIYVPRRYHYQFIVKLQIHSINICTTDRDPNQHIDVIMTSQIIWVSIVCSTVCSGADQIKHQSSTSLAFVRRIHRWPMGSSNKEPVTRKIFSIWWHYRRYSSRHECYVIDIW